MSGAGIAFRLVAGFGLWALAFVTLYGALSVGCAFGWDAVDALFGLSPLRLLLVGLTVVFLVAHAVLLRRMRAADGRGFVADVGLWCAAAAFAASLATYGAVVGLSVCAA
jgi:hypothetical protein